MHVNATAVRAMTRMMHNALIASMAKAWRRARVGLTFGTALA